MWQVHGEQFVQEYTKYNICGMLDFERSLTC